MLIQIGLCLPGLTKADPTDCGEPKLTKAILPTVWEPFLNINFSSQIIRQFEKSWDAFANHVQYSQITHNASLPIHERATIRSSPDPEAAPVAAQRLVRSILNSKPGQTNVRLLTVARLDPRRAQDFPMIRSKTKPRAVALTVRG